MHNDYHVKEKAQQDLKLKNPRVCFHVCHHPVTAGNFFDRTEAEAPGDLRPYSSSLVPWANGVSAFLSWVIKRTTEEWLHFHFAKLWRVYDVKCYHTDWNQKCCHKTDHGKKKLKKESCIISDLLPLDNCYHEQLNFWMIDKQLKWSTLITSVFKYLMPIIIQSI